MRVRSASYWITTAAIFVGYVIATDRLGVDRGTLSLVVLVAIGSVAVVRGRPEGVRFLVASIAAACVLFVVFFLVLFGLSAIW